MVGNTTWAENGFQPKPVNRIVKFFGALWCVLTTSPCALVRVALGGSRWTTKHTCYDHAVRMNSIHPPIREISGRPPPSIPPSVFSGSSCKTVQISASCRADLSRRNAVESEASAQADRIFPLPIHQRRSASISGLPVHLKNPVFQPGFSPNKKCSPLGSLPAAPALNSPYEY